MVTIPESRATQPNGGRVDRAESLHVSPFENVASAILALLILFGTSVFVLFIIWISNQVFAKPVANPVLFEEVGGGRPDGVVGESMQLDGPDSEEIGRETNLVIPEMEQTLAKVSSVIAARVTDLGGPELTDPIASGGGKLQGDGRQVGYGFGDGPPGVPRFKRWEIYFSEGGTLEEYAKQLDSFKIELAVVGGDQVTYLTNLASKTPTIRVGKGDQEKRLYMSWRQGNLKQADQQLLDRASVTSAGKLIVQFYPPDIETQLAQLELAFANRKPGEIRRTRFGLRPQGAGYQFYVIDQQPL